MKKMRLLILFCVFSLVSGENKIIDCNDNFQPYDKPNRKDIYRFSTDVEFNNCIFNTKNSPETSAIAFNGGYDIILNNCYIGRNFHIHFYDSNVKIYNSKIDNCPKFYSSDVEIKDTNMDCFTGTKMLEIKKSNVDIYNSIIYSKVYYHFGERKSFLGIGEAKKRLKLYQTYVSNKQYFNGNEYSFIETNREKASKEVSSEPVCSENNINPDKNVEILEVFQIGFDKKKRDVKEIKNYKGCENCPVDHYSTDSKVCTLCVEGSNWDKKTSSCIPCLYPEWCPTAFSCMYPHEGLGCSICQKGYFMLNNECKSCPKDKDFIIGIILGLIMTIIIGMGFTKITTDWIDELVIFSITVTHFQIMSAITDFTIQFPFWFKEFLNLVKSFFIDIFRNYLINSECITNFNYVSNFYFNSCLPFIGWFIINISLLFYYNLRKREIEEIKKSLIKINYTIINTLYLYQLSFPLKVFNVMPVQNTVVMRDNHEIRTSDSEWKGMMAFAFFYFSYCLITPYVVYFYNKDRLDFLEKKLKEGYHNYEVVWETYIKKGLIACWMIIPNIIVSHIFIFLTLIVCGIYHYKKQPFIDKHKVENKMVTLFYMLEILYLTMESVYLHGGFNVKILSICLMVIYLVSFLIIGVQLLQIFYKKYQIWLEKRKEKNKLNMVVIYKKLL